MKNPRPKRTESSVEGFDYQVCNTISLNRPKQDYRSNFFDLPFLRRSIASLSGLTDQELADLLWFTTKVIRTKYHSNDYILTHRPTPSAGAIHPIDLLIVPNTRSIVYYYNPFSHSLNQLKVDEGLMQSFIGHINKNLILSDATLIWFVAHVNRTASKYDHPESLVWRDAGALIQTIQLTCTAMNLGSCPIGTLAEPFLSQLLNDGSVVSAGGIIVGRIP